MLRWVVGGGIVVLAVAFLYDIRKNIQKSTTLYEYFLMGGNLPVSGFVSAIFSSNVSIGNFLIFVASWCYLFGWGGLAWFLLNLILNTIGFFLFLPKFSGYLENPNNSGSIHEFIAETFTLSEEHRSRRAIRLTASLVTIVGLLFAIVFELHLATELIAPLLKMERVPLFGLLTLIMCLYTAAGGFRTLIWTDIVQSVVMIFGTVCLISIFITLPNAQGALIKEYPFEAKQLFDIGWHNMLSISVVGFGWFLIAMDNWQRICATRSVPRVETGFLLYFAIICLFGVVYGLLGMIVKAVIIPSLSSAHSQGANPLADFFLITNVFPDASQFLIGVVAVTFIAAALSTANTFLMVCSHSFVSDALITIKKKTSIQDLSPGENRYFKTVARASVIGMGVFVLITWVFLVTLNLLTDPVTFFFIAYSIQFALLAPIFIVRLLPRWKPLPTYVLVSIILGVVTALFSGFGFWYALQKGIQKVMLLDPSQGVTLTPVITFVVGLLPIVIGLRKARVNDSSSSSASSH